jgi:hypothetical protein
VHHLPLPHLNLGNFHRDIQQMLKLSWNPQRERGSPYLGPPAPSPVNLPEKHLEKGPGPVPRYTPLLRGRAEHCGDGAEEPPALMEKLEVRLQAVLLSYETRQDKTNTGESAVGETIRSRNGAREHGRSTENIYLREADEHK